MIELRTRTPRVRRRAPTRTERGVAMALLGCLFVGVAAGAVVRHREARWASAAPARRIVLLPRAQGRTPEAARGVPLVPRAGRFETVSAEGSATVSLPARADEPVRVVDRAGGMALEVRLAGALPASATLEDGRLRHEGAWAAGAQLFRRATADGAEDAIALADTVAVTYEISLGAGVAAVRAVGGSVEFLDAAGDPRLRLRPPTLADAYGERHEVTLRVSGCEVDADPRAPWGRTVPAPASATCTVSMTWGALPYPALLETEFQTTGDLARDRFGHGMVTLANGRVLAAGGSFAAGSRGGALRTTEYFDPEAHTWAAGPTLPASAASMRCFLIADGASVFCWDEHRTSYRLDAEGGSWATTGSMHADRQGAAVARLDDGRILFVGGGSPPALGAELFDAASHGGLGGYVVTAPPRHARTGGAAVALADGRVLVAGGWNPTEGYLRATELWEPAEGRFVPGPDLPRGTRNGTSGIRLASGEVLLQGGFGVTQIFDPASGGSWREARTLPMAGSGPGLLGFVGTSPATPVSVQHAGVFLFDVGALDWSVAPTNTGRSRSGGTRYYGALAELADGRLVRVGGVDDTGANRSLAHTEIVSVASTPTHDACVAECADRRAATSRGARRPASTTRSAPHGVRTPRST